MKIPAVLIVLAHFSFISGEAISLAELLEKFENATNLDLETISSYFDIYSRVDFLYYSRDFDGPKMLKPVGDSAVPKKTFAVNQQKKTKVIIHGWMGANEKLFCKTMRDAYLAHTDHNVVIVDWSRLAVNFYTLARLSIHIVAPYVARMLDHLVLDMGVLPADIHLVGHSLGAHLAGLSSKKMTTGKVGRITGMDPASPLFFLGHSYRLHSDDADFVDIIHSSFIGYLKPIGHADFYPNGGGPLQPGCGLDVAKCTHRRSYILYAESIANEKGFVAWPCESWSDFKKGKCKENPVHMGEKAPPTARGMYFLRTAKEAPFALGDQQ